MADATRNVKSEISTMNSHESIEDAFSHTRAGALTQAALVPGSFAVVIGLLSMSPIGLVVAALGALELVVALELNNDEFQKFADNQQKAAARAELARENGELAAANSACRQQAVPATAGATLNASRADIPGARMPD